MDQIHHRAHVLDGRLLMDAVAQVEDVPGATGRAVKDRLHALADERRRREQHGGIEVALDGDVVSDGGPAGGEIDAPVETDHVATGLPVSFTDAREQVVYEVAMALAGGRLVSRGLYDRAVKILGHESITDVIVLMGYYTCVSLTMNFYAVPAGTPGLAR